MSVVRYVHTIRYLRPIQIYGRLWFQAYRPRPDLRPAPPPRTPVARWRAVCWRPPSMTAAATFHHLNITANVATSRDWDDPACAKLWRYNLHYFDDLNAQDAAVRESWHRTLIVRWVNENPPGDGTGWEPYPTSLRIVNWIKWALSTGTGDTPRLDHALQDSLATQTRWLRARLEVHLLGNHLWANAKALAFAGAFFQGAEPQRWLAQAWDLVERELREQILADGGHFERSPMYHAILLEDILDFVNLSRLFPACVPEALKARLSAVAERMLHWLRVMTHPDGRISFFNDSAFGVAPGYAALAEYAQQLAITQPREPLKSIEALPDSGYVRLQNDRAVVICDVGPIGPDHLPAHAHADSLSCELSLGEQRVVVNSGTSTYEPGAERQRQRSTAAHNTVVVDRQDSSEVWGNFRVARRARPFDVTWGTSGAREWLEASHDGYRRLRGRVSHRRRWTLEPNRLLIDDHLTGHFESACAFWHLSPDVAVSPRPAGTLTSVSLQSPAGPDVRLSFERSVASHEPSTWHPEFGQALPNDVFIACFQGASLVSHFTW